MSVLARRVSTARQALILLVPLLLVLGCGSGTRTAHRPDVVITQQEGFQSVRVHVGALVEVRLRALPGLNPWSRPASSDAGIVRPVDPPQQPRSTNKLTVVDYRAIKLGTVRLDSGASVYCDPSRMCPMVIRAWTVTVDVL